MFVSLFVVTTVTPVPSTNPGTEQVLRELKAQQPRVLQCQGPHLAVLFFTRCGTSLPQSLPPLLNRHTTDTISEDNLSKARGAHGAKVAVGAL